MRRKSVKATRLFAIGTLLCALVSMAGGPTGNSKPDIDRDPGQLATYHFQGFVLYVDLVEDTCSARFSEINAFEKIKEVYPELQYTIVVSETERDPSYYESWIKEHVLAGYTGHVVVDHDGFFPNQYGLNPGSKLFFFNRKKELVYLLPMTTSLKGRDYLEMFKYWY